MSARERVRALIDHLADGERVLVAGDEYELPRDRARELAARRHVELLGEVVAASPDDAATAEPAWPSDFPEQAALVRGGVASLAALRSLISEHGDAWVTAAKLSARQASRVTAALQRLDAVTEDQAPQE